EQCRGWLASCYWISRGQRGQYTPCQVAFPGSSPVGMLEEKDNPAFDGGNQLSMEFLSGTAGKPLDGFHESHIPLLHCIEQGHRRIWSPMLLGNRKHLGKATSRNTTPSDLVSRPVSGQLLSEPWIATNVGNLAETRLINFETRTVG